MDARVSDDFFDVHDPLAFFAVEILSSLERLSQSSLLSIVSWPRNASFE
jgi:hypothetical protein